MNQNEFKTNLNFVFQKAWETLVTQAEAGEITKDNFKQSVVNAIEFSTDMVETGQTCEGCNGCGR